MNSNDEKFTNHNSFSAKWVVVFLLLVVSGLLFASDIKKIQEHWDSVYSVLYKKNSNSYKTISRIIGAEVYEITKDPKLIINFSKGNVQINLYTYEEFESEINKNIIKIEYLNNLPEAIGNYIQLLEIKDFKLIYNLILLPKGYELQYESKLIKVSNAIVFTFVSSIDNEFPSQFELGLIRTLPHELFHFLVKYVDFGRMNLLRNETYAHLFGQCVSYKLNPLIDDEIELSFPDYFFMEPDKDFPKVVKKLKKSRLVKQYQFPKSHLGHALSRYYFQAVANNRTGNNISSDNIPKFCHKLFSEHNFKHPIEKKPPPWFKGF